MNTIKKILLTIVIVVCILPVALLIVVTIINSIKASAYQKDLNKFELPPSTSVVDSEYIVGRINSNGNGTNYYASLLLDSELSAEELKEYYSSFSDWCNVKVLNSDNPKEIGFSYDISNYSCEECYLVYVCTSPNNELLYELDLRGH
jgi:hypothetical protein